MVISLWLLRRPRRWFVALPGATVSCCCQGKWAFWCRVVHILWLVLSPRAVFTLPWWIAHWWALKLTVLLVQGKVLWNKGYQHVIDYITTKLLACCEGLWKTWGLTVESFVMSGNLIPEKSYSYRIEASYKDFHPDPVLEYHLHGKCVTEHFLPELVTMVAECNTGTLELDICREAFQSFRHWPD